MGNKIGDYIHYHASNYLTFGINECAASSSPYYYYGKQKNYVMAQVQAHKSGITDQQKKGLQRSINYILSDKTYYQPLNEARDKVYEKFYEDFPPYIRANIDQATAAASLTKLQSDRQEFKTKLQTLHNLEVKTKDDIMREMKIIFNGLARWSTPVNWEDLQKKVEDIRQQLNKLTKDSVVAFDKIFDLKDPAINYDINQIPNHLDKGINTSLLSDLNKIYDIVFHMPSISGQQGAIFEYIVQYAGAVALSIGQQAVIKEMENLGKERASVTINTNNFFDDFELYQNTFAFYKDLGNDIIKIAAAPTQQKIDIQCTFKNSTSKFNFSAKNYGLDTPDHRISVVSGTSLLFLIQNQEPSFINHYLNLIVSHVDDKIYESRLAANRLLAQKEMLLTLVYQGLTGDAEGRTKFGFANIFIIKNNLSSNNESIQIYDMEEIINTICNNLDNIDKYLDVTINDQKVYNFAIGQEWSVNGKRDRINNILNSLGDKKVHASIRARALTGMAYKR